MRRTRLALFIVALAGLMLAADASAAYRSGVRSGTYAGGRGGVSGIRLFHRSPYEVNRTRQPSVRHISPSRRSHTPTYYAPTNYAPTYHMTPRVQYVAPAPRVIYVR